MPRRIQDCQHVVLLQNICIVLSICLCSRNMSQQYVDLWVKTRPSVSDAFDPVPGVVRTAGASRRKEPGKRPMTSVLAHRRAQRLEHGHMGRPVVGPNCEMT